MASALVIWSGRRPVCSLCGFLSFNRANTLLRTNHLIVLNKFTQQSNFHNDSQRCKSFGSSTTNQSKQTISESAKQLKIGANVKTLLKRNELKALKLKQTQSEADATTTDSNLKKNESADAKKQVTKLTTTSVRENVKGYFFIRFSDHVKNYDSVLEKNFPSAMKIYRVFFDGVKEFYADMVRYLKISRIVQDSEHGLKALNRRELELLMQMPRDMFKVAPALILSSLPLVGYAIFPLALMYPHNLLTTHFWTTQQRHQFRVMDLQKRLKSNLPVFRRLQKKIDPKSKSPAQDLLENIFGLLGSGFHPRVSDILNVKEIFAAPPYDISSLSGGHIKFLCTMHGVPHGLFKRNRLREHAILLHNMDLAIRREGGEHNMNPDALRLSCYIRGLNPNNLDNDTMIEWLRDWTTISTNLLEDHLTLFLHLPIFLAYNHPNNWPLIYDK